MQTIDLSCVSHLEAQAKKAGELLSTMVLIMAKLRHRTEGCPWVKEQTIAHLRPYLLEEAHELWQAMLQSPKAHCEELGDVLMQLVFQAAIQEEEEHFSMSHVVKAIIDKLLRRHPHIFPHPHWPMKKLSSSEEVKEQWEAIKSWERTKQQEDGSAKARPEQSTQINNLFAGLPASLSALSRAKIVGERCAAVGFDFKDIEKALQKIDEERQELQEALDKKDKQAISDELGDLLLSISNVARKLEIDTESCLNQSVEKLMRRFAALQQRLLQNKQDLRTTPPEILKAIWQENKKDLP